VTKCPVDVIFGGGAIRKKGSLFLWGRGGGITGGPNSTPV